MFRDQMRLASDDFTQALRWGRLQVDSYDGYNRPTGQGGKGGALL